MPVALGGQAIMIDQVRLLGRFGGEFEVNPAVSGQSQPRVAKLASGGFVVVWNDAGVSLDIRAQIYDSVGARVGGEIAVKSDPALDQRYPSVTALASGGFAIVWHDDAAPETGAGQVFDATGNKVGGTITDMPGTNAPGLLDVAGLAGGAFVIVRNGGYGRLHSATGAPIGAEFTVGGGTPYATTAATALAGGGFAVIVSAPTGGVNGWIVQRFDGAGQKIGPEIAQSGSVPTDFLSVAALDTGGFVMTWSSYNSGDGSTEVRAQIGRASCRERV